MIANPNKFKAIVLTKTDHNTDQFIRRAAAVPNQIGRIKFGSSTTYESSLID